MNKREICRFIEKLGGCFNTDLRLWIIENKHSGLLMDYLKNNGIKYGKSVDGFYRIVLTQDHIIYVKAVKPYRKPVKATYTICYADKHARQVLHGIKDYKTLKYLIKNMQEIQYLQIYVDNREVCKSLWRE